MKAVIYDLMAWLAGVIILLAFVFYAATSHADLLMPNTPEDPMLQTRTQIIAGILIGIDLKQATGGLTSMTPDQAYEVATVLDKATKQCKDLECILNKLGLLIGKIREQKSRPHYPLEGEIIR